MGQHRSPAAAQLISRSLSLAALMAITACNPSILPSTPSVHEGVIVERDRPTSFEQTLPTIWVKETVEEECGVIYVVTPGTDLFARTGSGVEEIGVDRLAVGATVRIWTDIVLTSCPGQGRADAVELIGR